MPISTDNREEAPDTVSEAQDPASNILSEGELLAIELFTNTLLARAHFLFFLAALPGTPPHKRNALLEEADLALQEAEELSISGAYPIDNELKAKCWYVKGFGADTNGDHHNAVESYKKAIEIDNEYETFEGVRRNLHRQEDRGILGQMQNEVNSDAEALYGRLANMHIYQRTINQPSFPPMESNGLSGTRPHSDLFNYLLLSTTEEAVTDDQSESPRSRPSRSSTEDEVTRTVKQLARRPPRRRSSHQTPLPVHFQPKPQPPSCRREQGQTQEDAEVKHEQPKDLHGPSQTIEAHMVPSPGEETLLSDTPSISKSEVDKALGSNAALEDRSSPSRPTLHIQSSRRLSVSSPTSTPSSPIIPSPLRKASFPSDFADHAE